MTHQPTFSAQELSAYIKALGWIQVQEALKDGLFLFKHVDFSSRQLMFATDTSFDDYEESLENAAHKLAAVYHWSLADTFRKIEEASQEVLVASVPDEAVQQLTISYLYACQVMEANRKLLESGAFASEKRQPFYTRPFDTTKKLLEAARFRHTEMGSFVFKASCSLYALELAPTESQEQLAMFSEEEAPGTEPAPFVRRAMLNIGMGLEELVRSVQTGKEQELVDEVKKDDTASSVSANFCRAVATLRDREHPHPVDFWVAWSPILPPPPEAPRGPIRILPDYFPSIEEIGQKLQPRRETKRNTFIGTVEELSGAFNDLFQREGKVIISLLVENDERIKVRVTLDPSQYDAAMAVHKTNTVYVKVTGTVQPGKRQPLDFDLEAFDIINVSL